MFIMELKCYFTKLLALYSNRYLYGYKCNMEDLYNEIQQARRYYYIETYKNTCGLKGRVINDLNKFKSNMNKNYSTYCRTC